ncbi:MAG: hypothetical protein WCK67_06660 [bacterium]
MPIQGFNPQEFAKNLAQQASEFSPPDFNNDQKNYIVSKVYQFCMLAGDAINKDSNLNLNSEQACMISQFIGEWTFHKSVDLMKSSVPNDCWDHVLQTLAFAVFETAKNTQLQGFSPEDAVKTVEDTVKATYEKTINDLSIQGKIPKEHVNAILSQSNIDEMAKANTVGLPEDESTTMKMAAIALLLTTFSKEKAERILTGMPVEQSDQIRNFMNIKDLDQKLDASVALKYLNEFKYKFNAIESKIPAVMVNIKSFNKLYTDEEILNTVKNEREKVKEYVHNCLLPEPDINGQHILSNPISKIVYNYIRSGLSA